VAVDDALNQAWAALLARTGRPGVYGVASTKVYCDFGCPSRPPLRKNFRVFEAAEQAEAAGYRRCKRCAARDVARVRQG
jgi:AraC family transcriptional regulator, regulatory protein of adaptative response / methylated-DNA-[protein]-cysteine methyltransferase